MQPPFPATLSTQEGLSSRLGELASASASGTKAGAVGASTSDSPPSESLTQRQKVLSSLILDQGSHDSKREFFLSRKSDFKRKPIFNSMKSNNLEKSQNQNKLFTENLKIKQVQSESLATSFRSACPKSKFDVERFPIESGYASLDFQKRKFLLLFRHQSSPKKTNPA